MTTSSLLTNPPLEHGNCPNCKVSLDGGGIWDHFFNQKLKELQDGVEAELEADRISEMYGASRTKGRWGREIGIELDRDRIEFWRCPDCNYEWPR